jgi:glycosyltransferase involved in cell wall biosynthesis
VSESVEPKTLGMQRGVADVPTITVIVPTVASRARGRMLIRAIESIRAQQGVTAVPLVVANGPSRDARLLDSIGAMDGVRVVQQPEGSLPAALQTGRRLVDTPFFAFLDDDDELLPGALARRAAALAAEPSAAAAVTAGDFVSVDGTRVRTPDIPSIRTDPVAALSRGNWLASAAGLYRTDHIGEDVFANVPAYLEWTYVAMRLLLHHRIAFVDEATFVCNVGSPESLSASESYLKGQPPALRRIIDLKPPRPLDAAFRRKYAAALHHVSDHELNEGNYWSAWRYHLAALSRRGGLRYLSFTRRLILAAPRRIRPASRSPLR